MLFRALLATAAATALIVSEAYGDPTHDRAVAAGACLDIDQAGAEAKDLISRSSAMAFRSTDAQLLDVAARLDAAAATARAGAKQLEDAGEAILLAAHAIECAAAADAISAEARKAAARKDGTTMILDQ